MFRSPPADLLVILVIVLLFLGPKRLPGLGRGIGSGIREFKEGIGSRHDDDEGEDKDRQELTKAESGDGARTERSGSTADAAPAERAKSESPS